MEDIDGIVKIARAEGLEWVLHDDYIVRYKMVADGWRGLGGRGWSMFISRKLVQYPYPLFVDEIAWDRGRRKTYPGGS